jgi:hypothetical protein
MDNIIDGKYFVIVYQHEILTGDRTGKGYAEWNRNRREHEEKTKRQVHDPPFIYL